MDYRFRKYYLVAFNVAVYDMRIKHLKSFAPSLKIHPPYNHFKNNDKDYDGNYTHTYHQLMISCKKEEAEAVEYELRKHSRTEDTFIELTKKVCGQ